jgi:hypothetical protein
VSTITIGRAERALAVADRGWIGQTFDAQGHEGHAPCVRILLRAEGVDMTLQTLTCAARNTGGGRPPSREESEISRLWNMEGLSSLRYTAGQVADFVERVTRLLRR